LSAPPLEPASSGIGAILTAGTPLWATILLACFAAWLTHSLAKRREQEKEDRDAMRQWRKDATQHLDDILDRARNHYFDSSLLASTEKSAFEITGKLKKFSAHMRRSSCTASADMTAAIDLPVQLNEVLTDPPDFNDPNRSIRKFDDPLVQRLHDIEESLVQSISAPRKLSSR